MNNTNTLTYIVVIFLIANLAIGLWYGRGVTTIEDYAVGNKKWSTGALVMTYLATAIGASLIFRDANGIGTYGIGLFFYMLCMRPIAHIIRAFFLSNQISRFSNCNSLGDFMEKLYGKKSRIISGFLSFFLGVFIVAQQIKALSILFSDFFELNPIYSAIASGLIVAIYASMGGMKAVVSTDIVQFIMIFVSIFIIFVFAVSVSKNFSVLSNIPSDLISFTNQKFFNYLPIIFSAIFFSSSDLIESASFQRILMTREPAKMKKVFLYCAAGVFLAFFMVLIIVLIVVSISGGNWGLSPIHYVIHNIVPENFKPITLIGIIAMMLSTGDSWLHNAGLSFSQDVVEPFLKKKISLFVTKMTVFIIGIVSIYVSFKGEKLFFHSTALISTVAPVLSVPIFLGFLGIKTSARMFWVSTLFSLTSFFAVKFLPAQYIPYNILISCSFSFISYITTHLIENKKIIMIGNPIFANSLNKKRENKNYSTWLFSFRKFVEKQGSQYIIFGALYLCFIVIPYLFLSSQSLEYVEEILYLRTIGVAICAFLITRSIWPKIIRDHSPFIWYAALCYIIPFLSLSLIIINNGDLSSVISLYVGLLVLFLLVDWRSSVAISLIGFLFALLYTKSLGLSIRSLGRENLSIITLQSIISFILGSSFSRKRDLSSSIQDSKASFLQLIQTSIISNAQQAMTLPKREENQFNLFIALPTAKEKIKKILENYNSQIDINSLKSELLQLSEAIECEERTKIYQILNAKKHDLPQFSYKCEKAIKIAGCEDVSINIFTEKKSIRCDETSILKMLYKIANDHCKKIYSENSGDDTDLVLSFFDTKILYESDEETNEKKLFSRTVDGICIVLSEKDINRENQLVKNIYSKKLTDIELLAASTITDDVNFSDIETGIDAHYGILENHTNNDYLTWVCVIPADVYEIRPETLDMSEPINVKYNWPAAVELEKKFVKELQKFEHLNLSKIEYAISVIKRYHFHQTRKSGEPYYMHPINVAIIVLDIINQGNSEIYEKFKDNAEDLIIASLLHDILEDTSYSKKALTRNFGPKVRDLVLAVTKIDHSNRVAMMSNKQAFQDLIDKDPLSLCIKLADRLHNLMTIDGHPKVEKRKAVAEETIAFFVRAAERYKMIKLADNLRSMCEYIIKNGKIEGWKLE